MLGTLHVAEPKAGVVLARQIEAREVNMEPPFKENLHTNVVLTDSECQRIRELLAGPRTELAAINDEIERLQTLVGELMAKRDRLNAFIDPYAALISPMRRLPDDVVVEILTAALPYERDAVMSPLEAPLLVCHVCQAWRSLAFATPRLWASLHIVAPSGQEKLQRLDEAVNLWLSKSGVLPLSISVTRSRTCAPDLESDISLLIETVIRYSRRWNRIQFMLQAHPSDIGPLLALSPSDVPILESIVLEATEDYRMHDPIDWSSIALFGTMSLRNVSLRRLSEPLKFPVAWNQLRHLSLGRDHTYLSTNQVIQVFQECLNLETCTLSFGPETVSTASSYHMEHLRQLCVVDSWAVTTEFFANLVLPNLLSLEFESGNPFTSLPISSLLLSPNVLRRLSLRVERNMTSEILLECLRLVPALLELYIYGEPIAVGSVDSWSIISDTAPHDTFLTYLIPPVQDPRSVVCPALHHIRLSSFWFLSDVTLIDFICARGTRSFNRAHVAPLSSVDVRFSRPMQFDITANLQPLIADGLKLTLHYAKPRPGYSPSEENEAHAAEWEPISELWDEY
ncbi:hypothetical protein FB451DRAFT_1558771 [Mycena latifolia]|nr:hypothetical protein FB451DRAFT_1558771 [Mycena latifolia]